MELNTLQDLYLDQLKDLYSAETQLTKALPKMAQAASTPELKQAFETHLRETEGHVQRLEQIFQRLGESGKGKVCKAMQGLIAEGEETINEEARPSVKDAGLIAAAQRVEHYEMAGYGTVVTYAHQLGDTEAANLLQQTLQEEKKADAKLSQIAEGVVNLKAEKAQTR